MTSSPPGQPRASPSRRNRTTRSSAAPPLSRTPTGTPSASPRWTDSAGAGAHHDAAAVVHAEGMRRRPLTRRAGRRSPPAPPGLAAAGRSGAGRVILVRVDPGRTRVGVSVQDTTDKSPDHVWIDLLAVNG